jgi:hypothetical protein
MRRDLPRPSVAVPGPAGWRRGRGAWPALVGENAGKSACFRPAPTCRYLPRKERGTFGATAFLQADRAEAAVS